MSSKRKISIFGVTGSVGRAAMDVILAQPEIFDVQVVTAGKNALALAECAIRLNAPKAVIADEEQLGPLREALSGTGIEVAAGQGAMDAAAAQPCDLVLAATVGFAGLRPILKSLDAGINVAIANKEPLVAAGPIVMAAAKASGAKIIPVDSEHNAVFQVFENHNKAKIDKIILTASGGPFLNWTAEEMERATPAQALKHPNWVMGPKISIDSATMMNKALEVIEAHYLFNLPPEKIEVVIHPQSIVHAMVAYQDGSVLSQMGPSDMRVPIAHALGWPDRIESKVTPLDLTQHRDLTFMRPDLTKFKALEYAYKALGAGPEACIALNAANEVAVSNFLENNICFGDIIRCVGHVLENTIRQSKKEQIKSVEQIERCDTIARASANEYIRELQTTPKRKVQ